MGFRRVFAIVAASIGLIACGVAGTIAWQGGLWGSLTGAVLVAGWLCALNGWAILRPYRTSPPADRIAADADADADADATVLRVLLDAAPTPLVGIRHGTVRALNRAARRLFATDDRLLPAPAGLIDPASTHLRHEGRGWRIDRVAMADDRSVAALIDIEQEERTAEARATAELIQVLGHELFNGLAPIVSLAESGAAAVARPDVDRDLLCEILGTLARRAEGLQRFTDAYRTLARLPEPTRHPVMLSDMVDDLGRLFAGRWPLVRLTLAVEDRRIWSLDRDQVHQAVWALLQNAAEAATGARSSDACVMLRIRFDDAALAIEVADNGPGIPADHAARIFRPFHTTKAGGSGIGLSLARQIALTHGGTLTLLPGRDTVFRLLLPE